MNSCPTCGTQYTDQTLIYCLQDGTPLTIASTGETPTVLIVETETRDRIPHNEEIVTEYRSGRGIEFSEAANKNGRIGTAVKVVGGLAAVALVAVVGVASYLLGSRNSASNTGDPANKNSESVAANTNAANRPAAISTPASNTALVATSPTPFDDTQANSDLSARVASWKDSIESNESDSIVNNYTSTIDNYYGTKRAKASELQKAKAKKLIDFDSLRVVTSEQTIKVDESGKTASIQFDREIWFTGEKEKIHNKSRVEMKCRLVDGRWLIYSERDIKTYPTK